jgi:hypothetical protein
MKKLIYFVFLIFVCSCGNDKSSSISENEKIDEKEKIVLESFIGKYSSGTDKDGIVVMEVSCWSNSVEQLSIYKYEGNYSFTFDGFHAYNYEVLDAKLKDNKLVLSAIDPNNLGEMELEAENTEIFTFYFEEPFLIVESNNNKSIYIPESERANYEEIPCTNKEENLQLQIELHEQANENITEEIFWMLDTNEAYHAPFREEAYFPLITSGPGLYHDTTYIDNAEHLRAVVIKYFNEISPSYILDLKDNKNIYVVEEFPDRCQPDKVGLLVKFKTTDEGDIESAEVMLTVSSEYDGIIRVVFVLSYWWDENENIILNIIDLTDCSA